MSILSRYPTWATALCRLKGALFSVAVLALSPHVLALEVTRVPMTPAQWQVSGDVSFQHDPAEKNVLVVNKGYAELKRTNFGNGTIEFDAKFVGSRITGITFRQHDDAADALYFRPSADCAVSEECMPSFSIRRATVTPLLLIGTQISDLLRCFGPSPVLANRQIQSALTPLVIHILPPEMT